MDFCARFAIFSENIIEETGTNALYLVLGFLEWEELDKGTPQKRLAPLYMLPVELKKSGTGKGGAKDDFRICLRDDDSAFGNITLQEKLRREFGIELPDSQEQSPKEYFKVVEETVSKIKPDWEIKSEITLAILRFTRQAMYQDLDPAIWEKASAPIERHHIMQKLFASASQQDETQAGADFPDEYSIDGTNDIHEKCPLIYDADSSQHSALIDAVEGKNLVIEGPPGSGKSQTIANLIAACLNQGKTILFVAEKMTALNVVKDRLDKAGLGDFCLELYGHKTGKRVLLDSLAHRLDSKYDEPADIQREIRRYEMSRKELQRYAKLMNQRWGRAELPFMKS